MPVSHTCLRIWRINRCVLCVLFNFFCIMCTFRSLSSVFQLVYWMRWRNKGNFTVSTYLCFFRLDCILNGTVCALILHYVLCEGLEWLFIFSYKMVVQRMVWFSIFSAFRGYVGLLVSRYILCLHSVGVVADIKGSISHQSRRAYELSNSWFDSRQGQIYFSAPPRPDRLWGPPSLLAFGTDHLSSDEVTVATPSSFWSLNSFFF